MSRIYTIATGYQTHTAAGDLLELEAGASNPFILRQVIITQSDDYGDAKAGAAQIEFRRGVGYTSGTGGTVITPAAHNAADAAASLAESRAAATVDAAAGGGSLTKIYEEAMNLQGGMVYLPEPDLRLYFGPSQGLIIALAATPGGDGTTSMSVVATIEEL